MLIRSHERASARIKRHCCALACVCASDIYMMSAASVTPEREKRGHPRAPCMSFAARTLLSLGKHHPAAATVPASGSNKTREWVESPRPLLCLGKHQIVAAMIKLGAFCLSAAFSSFAITGFWWLFSHSVHHRLMFKNRHCCDGQ